MCTVLLPSGDNPIAVNKYITLDCVIQRVWYVVPNTLPVGDLVMEEFLLHHITDRQRIGYNVPQAVLHSLMLLKMGRIVAPIMSS